MNNLFNLVFSITGLENWSLGDIPFINELYNAYLDSHFRFIILNSSFLFDILIPAFGYIFILLSLFGSLFLEILPLFINILFKFYWNMNLLVEKYFKGIISFSLLFYLSLCSLEYLFFKNLFQSFILVLPILAFIFLSCIDKKLVKGELVNKITIFLFILLIASIVFIPLVGGLYFYEGELFKRYFSLFISIRSLFLIIIFIYIIVYFIKMPWTKENWIKFGVLIISLVLVGNFINITGKLWSNILLNINNENSVQPPLNIETELNKVDINKLSENLPSIDEERSKRKGSILDYLPSWLKDKEGFDNKFSMFKLEQILKGKYPKFNIFGLKLDINKAVPKSPLLSDRGLYDFSPPLCIRRPELLMGYCSIKPSLYMEKHFLCWDIESNQSITQFRYDAYLDQGFVVINSKGGKQVFDFDSTRLSQEGYNFYDLWSKNQKITSNEGTLQLRSSIDNPKKIPKIEILFDLDSLQSQFLLGVDNANSYKLNIRKSVKSVLIRIPYSFQAENLNLNPLITNRLILRPLRSSDALAYALCERDPEALWNNCLFFHYKTIVSARNEIENTCPNSGLMGVFLRNNEGLESELIGRFDISISSKYKPVISYILKKNYWGQGYGSEALEKLMLYYFNLPSREVEVEIAMNNIEVNKYRGTQVITATTFTFNERSENLLHKLGFKILCYQNGVWPKDNSPLTRLVKKHGYDIFKGDGYLYYHWVKNLLDPLRKASFYLPRFLPMPSFPIEDGIFLLKYRNLYRPKSKLTLVDLKYDKPEKHSFDQPQKLHHWILTEDSFNQRNNL